MLKQIAVGKGLQHGFFKESKNFINFQKFSKKLKVKKIHVTSSFKQFFSFHEEVEIYGAEYNIGSLVLGFVIKKHGQYAVCVHSCLDGLVAAFAAANALVTVYIYRGASKKVTIILSTRRFCLFGSFLFIWSQ